MAKELREGFTTGTAAAAAAKAAVLALLTGRVPDSVSVALPPFVLSGKILRQEDGQRLDIAVSGGGLEGESSAWAEVVKDGGDDPDATHGALIRVRASFSPSRPSLTGKGIPLRLQENITLHAGVGIGVATLPGLPVAVGEPAVNPQPRNQIAFAAAEAIRAAALPAAGEFTIAQDNTSTPGRIASQAASQTASRTTNRTDSQTTGQTTGRTTSQMLGQASEQCPVPASLYLLLEVPDGEKRARHTLNARLGIMGGISILGTRGTVRPYSHDAWQATISQGMAVAGALGITELILSTGRRSERLGFALFPHLPPQAGVLVADYAAYALREAAKGGFTRLRWVCFPGKLLKLAQGLEWTHARGGPADIAMLADLAREAGCAAKIAARITAMPTAAGAFAILSDAPPQHDAALRRLGDMAYASLLDWLRAACRESGVDAPLLTLHVFDLHAADRSVSGEGHAACRDTQNARPLMTWGENTHADRTADRPEDQADEPVIPGTQHP